MSSKFLSTNGGGANLDDGTTAIYASTLGAASLTASTALKTNASGLLTSTDLDTTDVTGLASALVLKNELSFVRDDSHTAPSAGQTKIYIKSDGNLYKKQDEGTESTIGDSSDKLPLSGGALSGNLTFNDGAGIEIGSGSINGLVMNNNRITGLVSGVATSEPATVGQLDGYLAKTGGQMSGDLSMDSNKITDLPTAVSNDEPATFGQVTIINDTLTSSISSLTSTVASAYQLADNALPKSGSSAMTGALSLGGNNINFLADGLVAGDAVNKSQLDAVGSTKVRLSDASTVSQYIYEDTYFKLYWNSFYKQLQFENKAAASTAVNYCVTHKHITGSNPASSSNVLSLAGQSPQMTVGTPNYFVLYNSPSYMPSYFAMGGAGCLVELGLTPMNHSSPYYNMLPTYSIRLITGDATSTNVVSNYITITIAVDS